MPLNPFRRWTVLLLFPQLMKTPRLRKILPTTLRPEAIPDKRKRPETQDSHPFLKNVQECPEHLRFATGFPPQPKIAGPKGKPMRTVHPDKIYREIIWFCSGYLRKSGPEATRTIINSIFCEWASIFNDYSSPFRGWTAGTVNSVTGYGTPCRSGVWEPR